MAVTNRKSSRIRLPGDLTEEEKIARMVRVNHAGEYGAKRIYEGQMAILKGKEEARLIAHMAEQEQVHLDYFSGEVAKRGVRPTALMPLWHVAGFMLGAATAVLGKEAAMACTVAVEEVIDEHYSNQLENMPKGEEELGEAIATFREEELEHRDIGLENNAISAPAYPILSAFIKAGSRAAIWLSERL